MAASAKLYGQFLLKALLGEIKYTADTIKVMLCTSAYVPDQDNHVYKASITNEVTGTGYTAGGMTLTTKNLEYTAGTNVIKATADNPNWANSTITARYAVIYDDTPAGNKPLIGYVDFGEDKVSGNGAFTITWSAEGVFTITTT